MTGTRKRKTPLRGTGGNDGLINLLRAADKLRTNKDLQNTINTSVTNLLNGTGKRKRRKPQRGGFRQTHAERQLWLATTPEKKAYWREQVLKEKAVIGGSIKEKLKTAGMIAAPIVATALMGAVAHKLHGNHVANQKWASSQSQRMDYLKRNNIL